jgi:hypothetical protein
VLFSAFSSAISWNPCKVEPTGSGFRVSRPVVAITAVATTRWLSLVRARRQAARALGRPIRGRVVVARVYGNH